DPVDTVVRERAIELGRRLGAHQRLADVLEMAAERTDSADLESELLLEAARISEDFLGDAARAETIYRRALDIDRSVAALVLPAADALDRLYAASGRHRELAEILEIRCGLAQDPDLRRQLLFRLAELYEVALSDPERAIGVLKVRVEDDPSDDDALAALERLYEKTAAFADLESVLRARADLVLDADLRRSLMVRRARLLADALGDLEGALGAWQAVRDDFGPDPDVLASIASLQRRTEHWDELATTLE